MCIILHIPCFWLWAYLKPVLPPMLAPFFNSPGLWPRACSDPSCLFATTHPFFRSCFFFLSAGPFSTFVACAYLDAVPWGPGRLKPCTRRIVRGPVSTQNRTLGRCFSFFAPFEKYHFLASLSAGHFSGIFRFYVDFGYHFKPFCCPFRYFSHTFFDLHFFMFFV